MFRTPPVKTISGLLNNNESLETPILQKKDILDYNPHIISLKFITTEAHGDVCSH